MAPAAVGCCCCCWDQVWNILDVLNVLQALVDKSGIVAELERGGGAELVACEGYLPNQSNVLRMLGYFSLIGQLRVSSNWWL
jgi:translation initiation factor 3 subunit L